MNKKTIISIAVVGALVLALAVGYQAKVGKRSEQVTAASSAESGHATGSSATGSSVAANPAANQESAGKQADAASQPQSVGSGKKTMADSVNFLKVSAEDKAAVIKTPDGKMQVVREGEDLPGDGLKLVEIGKNRVVMEEGTGKDKETVIVRLDSGKKAIQRISKTAPASAPLMIPHTEQVALESTQEQSKN